ncbi:MAG: hypothetical protein ACWA44_01480, partial [Thiotrichales bacterium]
MKPLRDRWKWFCKKITATYTSFLNQSHELSGIPLIPLCGAASLKMGCEEQMKMDVSKIWIGLLSVLMLGPCALSINSLHFYFTNPENVNRVVFRILCHFFTMVIKEVT